MKEFDKLVNTIKILRSPKGCPWDRAQKLIDARKHLIEETYELIDAIDEKEYDLIEEELGDLFIVLVFITDMLKGKGLFDLKKVLKKTNDKLISRHPHIFAGKALKVISRERKCSLEEKMVVCTNFEIFIQPVIPKPIARINIPPHAPKIRIIGCKNEKRKTSITRRMNNKRTSHDPRRNGWGIFLKNILSSSERTKFLIPSLPRSSPNRMPIAVEIAIAIKLTINATRTP